MGFIDSDEFIIISDKLKTSYAKSHREPLQFVNILRQYEKYGGLVLYWKMFGSSGHIRRPKGGLLVNYHRCYSFPLGNF